MSWFFRRLFYGCSASFGIRPLSTASPPRRRLPRSGTPISACHRMSGCDTRFCLIPGDNFSTFQLLSEALPRGCLEGYRENGLAAGDLVMERARNCTLSFEWHLSDWDNDKLTVMQQRWREHCRTFGLCGGLCVMDFPQGRIHASDIVRPRRARWTVMTGWHCFSRGRRRSAASATSCRTIWQPLSRSRGANANACNGPRQAKTDWKSDRYSHSVKKRERLHRTGRSRELGAKSRAKAIVLASRAGIIAA